MTQRYLAQRNDGAHRMRKGETLAGIASVSGVSLSRLLAANGWNAAHAAARGEIVRIPMPAIPERSGRRRVARESGRRRRRSRRRPSNRRAG